MDADAVEEASHSNADRSVGPWLHPVKRMAVFEPPGLRYSRAVEAGEDLRVKMKNRIAMAWILVFASIHAIALGGAAEQTSVDRTGASVAVAKPELPNAGLTLLEGFENDLAFIRAVSEGVASLEASAEREDLALSRAAVLLGAVNSILARQIEPACSRKLLRIDLGESGGLREALDHADALLTRVEDTLKEVAETSEIQAERNAVAKDHKTLHAFAAGLRAYLLPGKDDASLGRRRRAVTLLSPLIEDQDPAVSASATLWQACLRGVGSDIPRALSVLDLAVKRPSAGAMPYALYASVERCRLLAMQGGRATALALLMQVEGQCEEWLGETDEYLAATRMVQFAQMQILADWFDGAGSDGSNDEDEGSSGEVRRNEKKWCADRIIELAEEGFAGEGNGLFRLGEAIPIIAEPPTSDKEGGSEPKAGNVEG